MSMCDELQRVSSQVTRSGSDHKPTVTNLNTSINSNCSLLDFEMDLDTHYNEFMMGLSPCSSNCTVVSLSKEDVSFAPTVYREVTIVRPKAVSRQPSTTPSFANTSPIVEYKRRSQSYTRRGSNNYTETEIKLLNTHTQKWFSINLAQLCEFVYERTEASIQDTLIDRRRILDDLTVNHILVYIYHMNHNTSSGLFSCESDYEVDLEEEDDERMAVCAAFPIKNIGQIRLFNSGRSYTADRGISDPRYLTSQHFLKDLYLERCGIFHLHFSEEFNQDILVKPCAEMLIKSSAWRTEVINLVLPVSYHEALVNKIRKMKTSVGIHERKDATRVKGESSGNMLQPCGGSESASRQSHKHGQTESSKSKGKRKNSTRETKSTRGLESTQFPSRENKSSRTSSSGMMRLKRMCSGMFAITGHNVEVPTL